jgi:hypothetical protein
MARDPIAVAPLLDRPASHLHAVQLELDESGTVQERVLSRTPIACDGGRVTVTGHYEKLPHWHPTEPFDDYVLLVDSWRCE